MSGRTIGRCGVERQQANMPEVLHFRVGSSARLRILNKRISENLMVAGAWRPVNRRLLVDETVMEVDDRALVIASDEGDDLRFVVGVEGAARVLVVSNDIDAVAEIVAGYIICRENGDEELERHLS